MATQESSYYYVPETSRLPLFASLGLFLMAFGAAFWITGSGPKVFFVGCLVLAAVLWFWFSTVITENMAGLSNARLKRSYVWGMSWFIFSEVMFFSVFFGSLFYIRQFSVPWLGGEGSDLMSNQLLWQGFQSEWPLLTTPEQAKAGEAASRYIGPSQTIGWVGLPLVNTLILLSSSVTVHIAHTALKNNRKKHFNIWLGLTALGLTFLYVQVIEYAHAYRDLGLTLKSGVYGTTFFMLTGFHGAHVAIGTFMLIVMWSRSVLKGHFKHDDAFGFEAASWYWHFVDVVWAGLFIFVYVLGS